MVTSDSRCIEIVLNIPLVLYFSIIGDTLLLCIALDAWQSFAFEVATCKLDK